MTETQSAAEIAAAAKRYIEEGNASLRGQLAAFNRLRVACGEPPLKLVEARAKSA